jgi:hypothetical protein
MRYKTEWMVVVLVSRVAIGAWAEDRDQEKDLRDFIGAVYGKRGSWTLTSGENALSDRGCVRKVGNNYFTPEGCYRKIGNSYVRPDGEAVVTTGKTWLSGDGAVVSTGKTYLGSGRNKVSAGSTVLDAEEEK